jgi:GT2 family glycosyltransferase
MDAHTFYPPDYLASGIRRLEQGGVDWVAGPQLPQGADAWSRRIELALRSRLGVGGAAFRTLVAGETETDAGFTGVWRRETLEHHEGWDEDWPINEDAELAARIRKAGGRIVCVPEMAAHYVPRRSLRALARQYWRYGQYRAKTSQRHPESARRSHFIPPALVVTAAGALLPGRIGRAGRLGVGLYAAALILESARLGREHDRRGDALRLPAVFATMHATWGAGFLAGSARFGPPLAALGRAIRPPR